METSLKSHARFEDVRFTGVDSVGGELVEAKFYDCVFAGCSFVELAFNQCRLINCQFQDCDLSLLQLNGSTLSGVEFIRSKLVGINWTLAKWSDAFPNDPISFMDCALNHSTFYGLHLPGIDIIKCSAKEVDFRECDLTRAIFTATDLEDSLFGSTKLSEADLSKAKNYNINPQQNDLSGAKFSLPEALSLLFSMNIVLVENEDE